MVSEPFAAGDNYHLEVVRGHARCKVWRRRDLDSVAGAEAAEEVSRHLHGFAVDPEIRSLVFDVREAPSFIGPRTQAALGAAFRAFEESRKPAALVTAAAVQAIQLQRMLGMHAPLYGRDFRSHDEAVAWAESFHPG